MAHRMSNGRIVMELHLVSLLVQTAIIRKCQLELQSGLILEASWMHVAGLLPCVVSPKGSVKLLYFVRCAHPRIRSTVACICSHSATHTSATVATHVHACGVSRQTPEGEAEGANDELHERFTTLEAEYEIMAGPPLSFPREVPDTHTLPYPHLPPCYCNSCLTLVSASTIKGVTPCLCAPLILLVRLQQSFLRLRRSVWCVACRLSTHQRLTRAPLPFPIRCVAWSTRSER
jgi:hypothetical protein